MIINQTKSYTILEPSINDSVNENQIILNFHKEFNEKYPNFNKVNLIINFSNNINTDLKEILLFSQYSVEHKKNKKSFVIVCNGIKFDKLPNELVAVPTLNEAEDIIEIEDIERDLGI